MNASLESLHPKTHTQYLVVEARGLTKIYGKQPAVDAIDFSVKRSETFGLLGPNGAGKSTTMRMIACRTPLTSGELLVEGLDVRTRGRQIRSLIGVVPQENNLDPDLNVIRNLIVYASYFRIPRTQAAKRAIELLHFIGLSGRADSRIDHLEAEKLCERLVVIDHGQILATGTPKDLVLSKVSRYALEVREVGDLPLHTTRNGVAAIARNNAHFYFAAEAETLTPLMKEYEGRRRMIRLSNLEDVFLQLVSDNESEPPAVAGG